MLYKVPLRDVVKCSREGMANPTEKNPPPLAIAFVSSCQLCVRCWLQFLPPTDMCVCFALYFLWLLLLLPIYFYQVKHG